MSSSLIKYDEAQEKRVQHAQSLYRPHKRPKVVLDEEHYIQGLSSVIKRQFFPDRHTHDTATATVGHWRSDGQNIQKDRSTVRQRSSTRQFRTDLTPRINSEQQRSVTPGSPDPFNFQSDSAGTNDAVEKKLSDTELTLSEFQAKYTSEDNASFLQLLDQQNLKNREKYAWHYNNNKIYSENTEFQETRLLRERAEEGKIIGLVDDRRATQGWKIKPKNALLFPPDDLPAAESPVGTRSAVKPRKQARIEYKATRMPDVFTSEGQARASSPSLSQVDRAIRGEHGSEPNKYDEDDDDDEVRVNGYALIDEPDTPMAPTYTNPFPDPPQNPELHKPNPFKIPETPARDQLLDRLVSKNTRGRRPTPTNRPQSNVLQNIRTPKFKSSPLLTPAAQRMMGRTGGNALRDRLQTPSKSKLR